MLRALVSVLAVLQVLVPDRIVAASERFAFENPGGCALRPWTLPIARLEGVAFLALAVAGGDAWMRSRRALALVGLPAALAPRSYLRLGLSLAYEDPDCPAVRSWVVPITRTIGVVYVLAAIAPGRAGDATG